MQNLLQLLHMCICDIEEFRKENIGILSAYYKIWSTFRLRDKYCLRSVNTTDLINSFNFFSH